MSLSVKMDDLSRDAVEARYPKEIAQKIVNAMASIGREIGAIDNSKYAIPIRHEYYITKRRSEAAVVFAFSKDAEHATFIQKELHDMQKSCPHRATDCIQIINERISKEIPNFVNPSPNDESKRHTFNQYIFHLFVDFYDLKQHPEYCYQYKSGEHQHLFTYSDKAINLILEAIKKDPEHIVQGLKIKLGKSTPGAKEF